MLKLRPILADGKVWESERNMERNSYIFAFVIIKEYFSVTKIPN